MRGRERMCGITGLFLKNRALHDDLGRLTGLMMREMCDRGPDSAGFAIYGAVTTAARPRSAAVSARSPVHWDAVARCLGDAIGAGVTVELSGTTRYSGPQGAATRPANG